MRWLFALWLGLGFCLPVSAALKPNEVVVLAMKTSPESLDIAKYYASARGIPESHILLLPTPYPAVISRNDWETRVAPEIRKLLDELPDGSEIRCVVTTWDIPYKIGPVQTDAAVKATHLQALRRLRDAHVVQINQLFAELDSLFPPEKPTPREPLPNDAPWKDIAKGFQEILQTTDARVQPHKETPEGKQAIAKLEQALLVGGGLNSFLRAQTTPPTEQNEIRRLDLYRGQLQGLREGLSAVQSLRESAARDEQILGLLDKSDGLLGGVQWIDQYVPLLKGSETYSSFDSELALLYWSEYPLIRWIPNVLAHPFDAASLRAQKRTLMVSRLEAPTVDLVKKLIDQGIATEKDGLKGKFYIDARGIGFDPEKGGRGSYGDYDQALRQLAEIARAHSTFEVVLDNKPELFPAGSCPDAALYCGWYSLANYVDAFQWNPGTVAYHIASSEAVTLRDTNSKVWCKRMLEEGVTATLGPVYEPYLAAFPRPDEFFPLLMSGRCTLAETYYRTLPFNSWVMVLVGDPLYNPFGNHPALKMENLPQEIQRLLPAE